MHAEEDRLEPPWCMLTLRPVLKVIRAMTTAAEIILKLKYIKDLYLFCINGLYIPWFCWKDLVVCYKDVLLL